MYSEGQKNATKKYKAKNYKRVPFDVPNSFYDKIKHAAEHEGKSVNGLIKSCIEEHLIRAEY